MDGRKEGGREEGGRKFVKILGACMIYVCAYINVL